MAFSTQSNLDRLIDDQRKRGFRGLRFSPFVEEDFREAYGRSGMEKARPILMLIGLGVMAVTAYSMLHHKISLYMAAFELLVLMPILVGTLVVSFRPRHHAVYQILLAFSAFCIGLVITSITTRASLAGMPYYFAAEVSCIFVIWLVLGLLFRHAMVVSALISCAYFFGIVHWGFPPEEALFEGVMLVLVNLFGAYCCYQLEYASRKAFLESKLLNQLAERDGLTALHNRRSFDDYMERIWRQSRREQTQLTIMMIDIDHFKAYNDYYGHQAGDDALKKVAEVISMSAQRPLDFSARYGGEEFALVLFGPVGGYGYDLPDQIRKAVMNLKIEHKAASAEKYMTISIGVALVMPGAERSQAGAIQMADEALYQAKEDGRNRVVIRESKHTHVQTGRFRAAKRLTA